MPDAPRRIEKPFLLVVEGRDEELFFQAACSRFGATDIQILGIGGKTKLPSQLQALTLTPGFAAVRSLGIIRDADNDPSAAANSIQNALQKSNLPVPSGPQVLAPGRPNVAFLVLPDSHSPGSLEDLCLRAVAEDPATSCVDQFFECLATKGIPLPRELSKAKAHAFLATRPIPDKRLGEAALADYLPWNHPAWDPLRDFLRLLVGQ